MGRKDQREERRGRIAAERSEQLDLDIGIDLNFKAKNECCEIFKNRA